MARAPGSGARELASDKGGRFFSDVRSESSVSRGEISPRRERIKVRRLQVVGPLYSRAVEMALALQQIDVMQIL